MSLAALEARASEHSLSNFGTLPALPSDGVGDGTIVLLGPGEPGFWDHVTAQPEFKDQQDHPLDRWSKRVIMGIADTIGGQPLFPFGDPLRPFFTWAVRSGRAWQSPVVLLVHDHAGLMVSYRGAILLPDLDVAQSKSAKPCDTCADKPCLTACPAKALIGDGYDLDACHAFLDTERGKTNLLNGCEVRRSCPVSKNYGRSDKQSAFHMERFHPCR
jgi:hypothetical protein